MDQTGKVVWSRASEIQAVNVMTSSAEPMDGEPIQLAVKDLGASEVYPSTLVHSPYAARPPPLMGVWVVGVGRGGDRSVIAPVSRV